MSYKKRSKGSRERYAVKLTRKQIESVFTALAEWAEVESYSLTGPGAIRRRFIRTGDSIMRQLQKTTYYLLLPLALLLTGCGQQTSCRIIPVAGTEKPGFTNSCPSGQVVTGIQGSTLTCAEVSVLCPTK